MYSRNIIVDPANDQEIEFAQSVAILSPFPDWVYVPVPLSCVGFIIGKSGARIAQMASKYKVKITAPRRGENPVFGMFGNQQAISGAKAEIDLLVQSWLKDGGGALGGSGGSGSGGGVGSGGSSPGMNSRGGGPYSNTSSPYIMPTPYTNSFFSGYQAPMIPPLSPYPSSTGGGGGGGGYLSSNSVYNGGGGGGGGYGSATAFANSAEGNSHSLYLSLERMNERTNE